MLSNIRTHSKLCSIYISNIQLLSRPCLGIANVFKKQSACVHSEGTPTRSQPEGQISSKASERGVPGPLEPQSHPNLLEDDKLLPFESIPGPKPLPVVGNLFLFTRWGKLYFIKVL